MKYFIDTEFIEGFHKPLFGKKRHFVDLISIGIVAEDGREYYAISNEFDSKDASEWVKDNVILPMYQSELSGDVKNRLTSKNFHKEVGKSNEVIRKEIIEFVSHCSNGKTMSARIEDNNPEFYAYCADYDWVVFCSLFGTMMDLPKGFPMYCKDLKQDLDSLVCVKDMVTSDDFKPVTFEMVLEDLKKNEHYPNQENEHNALADAKWNMKLYEFIKLIKS